jgi:hypothetical protein
MAEAAPDAPRPSAAETSTTRLPMIFAASGDQAIDDCVGDHLGAEAPAAAPKGPQPNREEEAVALSAKYTRQSGSSMTLVSAAAITTPPNRLSGGQRAAVCVSSLPTLWRRPDKVRIGAKGCAQDARY